MKTSTFSSGPAPLHLATLLAALLPWTAATAGPDLVMTVTSGPAEIFTNNEYEFGFRITLAGTGEAAGFAGGDRIFVLDLPVGFTVKSPIGSSRTLTSGSFNCQQQGTAFSCAADPGGFSFNSVGGYLELRPALTATMPGGASLPAAGGVCHADPDNLVSEDDETNNDCEPRDLAVLAEPTLSQRWLQVSMWDNFARAMDANTVEIVDAAPIDESDGTPIHTLSDIVRDPTSGVLYVFPRRYQSNTHRLGIFDPEAGSVTDIGDTGLSFHDAAFTDAGVLYAVGRDGLLYSVNTETAVATARCDTGYGSGNGVHSSLAWDSGSQTLVQIADYQRIDIDPLQFPAMSSEPCVSSSLALTQVGDMDVEIWAAYYESGVVQFVDYTGDRFYVNRSGATGQLPGVLPHSVHGMVPGQEGLPQRTLACPAPYYALLEIPERDYYRASLLFAIDESGSLQFIASIPGDDVNALEYDPRRGSLVLMRGVFQGRLLDIDPCSGNILQQRDSVMVRGLDIQPDGSAYILPTQSPALLSTLDLDTAAISSLGGVFHQSQILGVIGDEVFLADGGSGQTSQLDVYSLSNYDQLLRNVALNYGPGLDASSGFQWNRFLRNVTPYRDASGRLLGTLHRADKTQLGMKTTAQPNALVSIDAAGGVALDFYLPANLGMVTATFEPLFGDGFEDSPAPRARP